MYDNSLSEQQRQSFDSWEATKLIREQIRSGDINSVDIQQCMDTARAQGFSTLLTMHDWWADEWWDS